MWKNRGVMQVLGDLQREKGGRHEDLVVQALHEGPRPAWIQSSRKATPEEDARGIDVVVETDVGKLLLQVKSSKRGQERFLEKKRSSKIHVVLVYPNEESFTLLRRLVGLLTIARKEVLNLRTG